MSINVIFRALVNSKTLLQTHTIVRVTLVHEKNQTPLVLCEILFKRVCSTRLTTVQNFLSVCKREPLFSDIRDSSGLLIRGVRFLRGPIFWGPLFTGSGSGSA